MACFAVPGAEAIVVTAAAVMLRHHEQKQAQLRLAADHTTVEDSRPTGFSRKLFWLAHLLWGGVALLAFEHLWHGEVQPFFPFLTAATEGPEAVSEMLHEMATVGVSMAILVTAIWGAMVAVSAAMEKRAARKEESEAAV